MPRTRIDPTLASESEALIAQKAFQALEAHETSDQAGLRVQITEGGREVMTLDVPSAAVSLILALLKEMGEGKAVTVVSDEPEITTRQAADLLHVSRPYLVGMIEKGELPARMVGKQRRLPLKDVLTYKRDNEAKRKKVLSELIAHDQELGLL